MRSCVIRGAVEVPYARRGELTTAELLSRAFDHLVAQVGIDLREIDGLGVASFTLRPDRAIDLAWRCGLTLSWSMDDGNGGASGLNLLQHAVAAIETGQARHIVLLAGDAFQPADFQEMQNHYNGTTRDLLRPLRIANPNSLFALLTKRHMARHGLERRDYGELVTSQRRWAERNPNAVYRSPLSIEQYLDAPVVASPLVIFDCVPVVHGANAILVSHIDAAGSHDGCVQIRSIGAAYNVDQQDGDGLSTGLRRLAPGLYDRAGVEVTDVDVVSVYDDYPVMSLVQLEDLGIVEPARLKRFLRDELPAGRVNVNTSGGQLSAGQAGCGGGMHGLVEVARQLAGQCGERQVLEARIGLVSGYGMVEYRYGMCANAVVLEAMA